jgi:hypothetical protein
VGTFASCRPLAKIVQEDFTIDPLLFNKQSSEEDIEKYLGLIN